MEASCLDVVVLVASFSLSKEGFGFKSAGTYSSLIGIDCAVIIVDEQINNV